MLRSAMRSTRRASAACQHQQRQQQQMRKVSQMKTPPTAVSSKQSSSSPVISQAMLLDRFGKQHRYDYHHRDPTDGLAQTLSYWKIALAASGVCIASSVSNGNTAQAASSKGDNSGKGSSDPFEELKQKLQELSGESLALLQKLLPDEYKDVQKHVTDFLESGKGGQISWGFAMGVCSGFALKKVSKAGAIALGTLFVLMQCASYSGYIDVNYKKLERDLMDFLDMNKDGKFDSQDVDTVYKQVMQVLEFSLPAGSGYTLGFLVGFRAG